MSANAMPIIAIGNAGGMSVYTIIRYTGTKSIEPKAMNSDRLPIRSTISPKRGIVRADISGRMSTGNEDHKEILYAMQARDVAAAEVALRNHLVVTCDAILAHWPEAVQPASTEFPPKE